MFPESLKKIISFLSRFPSLGPRQATRLGLAILRQGEASIHDFAKALLALAAIRTCTRCFFPYETVNDEERKLGLCAICRNPNRLHDVIAIVEKETDLVSLEKAKKFNGTYLVVGEFGRDGMLDTEQKLRIGSLKKFIEKRFGKAKEIILALNHTVLGGMGAESLAHDLRPFAEKITRLGRGLPTGGEIEFADEDTLLGALENRR